jgi:predicted aspartyl protease
LGFQNNVSRRGDPGRSGKRRSPGVKTEGGLLGQMPTTRITMAGLTDMISSIGPYGKNKKVILWVKIKGKDKKEHTTMAMIDCGATENFIDRQFAEQQQLPLTKKVVPRRVLTVDRRGLIGGPIMHDATVTLTINDHWEEIKLHCITIGNSPIIVGLPWLQKHNPNINWKEGRITFDLEKCGNTCLTTSPHATMITEKRAEAEYE